jgi:CheY-like chemotaxis protein
VGKVTIETANCTFDQDYCAHHLGFLSGEYVSLAVSDDGCGMDTQALAHLFEPFYTTKETGKGTGLGLSTVYGIVKQNNGFINVYSEPGDGTTFRIYLPRHEGATMQAPQEITANATPDHSGTILLLEDEPALMRLGEAMLEKLGYQVLAVASPNEAIRLAEEHNGNINLLITDVIMPEMNGRQLAARVQAFRPRLKVLFMSGYTSNVIAHRGVLEEGVHFIQKPFSLKELAAKIRQAMESE